MIGGSLDGVGGGRGGRCSGVEVELKRTVLCGSERNNNYYLVHCFRIMYMFLIILTFLCFITVILCAVLQVLV